MGADIWIGRRGEEWGLTYFRESYGGAIALNAIRLSYWGDLTPKLLPSDIFPIELNDWLLGEIKAGIAKYLDGPKAAEYAREYLDSALMPNADPERMILIWRRILGELIELIEESSRREIPLTMSL